jgi:hypothetical protein
MAFQPQPGSPGTTSQTLPQWTANNPVSTTDVQLRNLDREFKAGKISLEEYRKIKKVLQGGE